MKKSNKDVGSINADEMTQNEVERLISETEKKDVDLNKGVSDAQLFLHRYQENEQVFSKSAFSLDPDILDKIHSTEENTPTTNNELQECLDEDHELARQKLQSLISRSSSKSKPWCKDCGRELGAINNLLSVQLSEKIEKLSKQQRFVLKGQYKCKICWEVTNDKENMRKHMLNHISEGEVACEQCLSRAKANSKQHAFSPVFCTHCYKDISDTSNVAMKPSVSVFVAPPKSERKLSNRSDSSSVASSKEEIKGQMQSSIICKNCENEMNRRWKFVRGRKEVETVRPSKIPLVYFSKAVQCRDCDRAFSDVGQVIKQFVSSERRRSLTSVDAMQTYYVCNLCNFKSPNNLNEHIANHAVYRDFSCSDCLGATMRRKSIYSSSRSGSTASTERKPSSASSSVKQEDRCTECNKPLDMSEELASGLMHCKLDTDKRLYYYYCNMCTERRHSKCLLKRHLKSHIKEGTIKCLKCRGIK